MYIVLNWALLILGLTHCVFTFKKYNHLELDAIWFFATGLALILCGLLNYININFSNTTISIITVSANIAQMLLCLVLAYNFPKAQTILAFILVLLVLINSILFIVLQKQ
jgi:hypothetical protein